MIKSLLALVFCLVGGAIASVQPCLIYGSNDRAVLPFITGFAHKTYDMYVDPDVRNNLTITCQSFGDFVCFRCPEPGSCAKNTCCWQVPEGMYSFQLQSPISSSTYFDQRGSILLNGAKVPQAQGSQDQENAFSDARVYHYNANGSQSTYDVMVYAAQHNQTIDFLGASFFPVAESTTYYGGSTCNDPNVVYIGPVGNGSPGCAYGTCSKYDNAGFRIKPILGKKCQSTPNCKLCAWPYASVSNGCGCIVDPDHLQPESDLIRICAIWANTAGSDGTQYYYDRSRSNFNPDNGPVRCAASSPSSGKTLFMPAGQCPQNDDTYQFGLDSAHADSLGDTLSEGSMKDREPSASGTGSVGNGSDTATHNRLDTIIGQFKGLREYLDTVGSGSDTGFWSNERDSAIFGLDTALNGLSDLTEAVNTHSSRGDTTGYNGYTLDSLLDICAPYGDSIKCMSQESTYPILLASAKWIIRACLFLWGVLMFWMFLSIAKSED